MLGHKIHGTLASADYGLPGFHGQRAGPGHQGQLLQRVATVWDLWREGVVLSLVGEGLFIEGLHHNLDLFFEHLTVGIGVGFGTGDAESIHFSGVVASANTEYHPPFGQNIRGGVIFCLAERMPHGIDVEPATKFKVLGQVREVDIHHEEVGYAFVSFRLEMVLG